MSLVRSLLYFVKHKRGNVTLAGVPVAIFVMLSLNKATKYTLIFAHFIEHKYIFTQIRIQCNSTNITSFQPEKKQALGIKTKTSREAKKKKKGKNITYKKVFNVHMKYQFRIPMEHYDVAYYRRNKERAHTHTRHRSGEKERGAQVRQCAAVVI